MPARAEEERTSAGPRIARAVIFDFDGVVADTERLHFECFAAAVGEEGISITREDHDRRFLGLNDRVGFAMAFADAGREFSPALCAALIARKSGKYRARMAEVLLFPGVARLLDRLAARVPLAIASGGRSFEIDSVLRGNGVRDRFLAIVSADEVFRSKPDPDPFLRARDELLARAPALGGRLAPAECVVVEDSLPGIEAARAAGMRCLAVAHTFPPATLAAADRVAARLGDLTADEVLAT